ncbi:hypothetical protein DHEL01_v201646 [Diaporthe helianthi]|uniref:Uncharacterized protein n=1 Tax=Diaporthe helianthi TaxID=158607 RepID=A0A2P5IBT2_DIAHE|nr:hypothetical protein DHEL01_v201646 [Diaporthe helianthi]
MAKAGKGSWPGRGIKTSRPILEEDDERRRPVASDAKRPLSTCNEQEMRAVLGPELWVAGAELRGVWIEMWKTSPASMLRAKGKVG